MGDFVAKADPDFRIWMSCEPREGFPLGLLQKAVKVTNEPPKGVRAGLLRTFNTIVNAEFLEKIDHPNWRTLLYGVCFLHSVVIERKKFGSLGWCVPYEYNNSDLAASLLFIERYLDNLQKISGMATNPNQNFQINYTVLIIMICDIQYGGRITDNLDRELFTCYGENWFRETITTNEFQFAKVSIENQDGKDAPFVYKIPMGTEHKVYTDYIEKLPAVDSPEIFGLNSNADLTFRLKETNMLISTIMETRPKDSGDSGGKSRDEQIQDKCRDMQHQLTYEYPVLDTKELIQRMPGPKGYPDKGFMVPLNIFLSQEVDRMTYILYLVRKTFQDIIDAVDGSIIMTPDIVDAIDALFDGRVPPSWVNDASGAEISWIKPSFPLWFNSLLERNLQLTTWLKNERPKTFSLAGFFNPQGFLTAMKQEVVRLNKNKGAGGKGNTDSLDKWSMELVDYSCSVLNERQQREMENVREAPGEGVYIHGLWLEGCKWRKDTLDEATEKKMTYPLNILHVTAVASSARRGGPEQERRENAYNCPVYKYPMRNDRYLVFRVLLLCVG